MNALKTSLLATALCLGLGAAPVFAEDAAPTDRTAAQAIDDATITASIKTKLLADERTKGFDINVDTMKGVVTLRGGADSQAAKQAAQEVAGQAEGVVLIKNELIVATDDSEARQDADTATASGEVREKLDESGDGIDDAWITSKVKTQLLADTAVKGTQIDVDTKANVVTLTGTAESQAAKDAAIRIAAGTSGVQKVIADQLLVKQ
jgi:hyperosmotically inducible protein